MKKRKQTRRRRDAAQRRGKLGISTVIVVLIAVFLLRGHTMDQRNAAYVEELAQLQNKIDAEEARTQDIADLEAYMQMSMRSRLPRTSLVWSMKMRLFLNQKRTKEKGERQRDKLPFFFVENFFWRRTAFDKIFRSHSLY